MANWKPIVGLPFSAAEFDKYCKALTWSAWRPSFVAIHNTAIPDLAQRPNGFSAQHIRNLEHYYRVEKGWSAGPHLFVDDKQIWVFTPLTTTGRHSPSWHNLAIGIEMLGNYDVDSFTTGRGLKVKENAVSATASICRRLGLDPKTIRLHKEDPATDHDCPGENVNKEVFIKSVENSIRDHYASDHDLKSGHPD